MTSILGLIPARGGSKGIPRKNLREVAGKPLLAWTIAAAKRSALVSRLIVSTDDPEIAAVARACGAEVPFLRPAALATDAATSAAVAEHALAWLAQEGKPEPEFLLQLQPTSPLRLPEDIAAAAEMLKSSAAPAVVSVCPCGHPPHWLKRLGPGGKLLPLQPGEQPARRQDAEQAYELNGAIYLIRTAVFHVEKTYFPRGVVGYVMPRDRSLDIDTPWDLRLAELILAARPPSDHAG